MGDNMSDEQQQQSQNVEKSKNDKLYESVKSLDVLELMNRKMTLVKDLDKNMKVISGIDFNKAIELLKELDKLIKQLATINVTKGSERVKISRSLEKVTSMLSAMSIIDQVSTEKNKISKALERITEISEAIPVIEKVLKDKDF